MSKRDRPFARVPPRIAAILVAGILFVAAAAWLGGVLADRLSRAAELSRLESIAQSQANLLESQFGRFRLLPLLLASDADVLNQPESYRTLDRKLARLARDTGAGAIYIIDATGLTVSASNSGTPLSFVGNNYAFRGYFKDAQRFGTGLDYALGTVSGRPGLFLSHRTQRGDVVVVKLEFAAIENAWAASGGTTLVENASGTVLMTSDPALRFRNDERFGVDRDKQPLLGPRQITATVPVDIADWRLVHSVDSRDALGSTVLIARITGGLIALCLFALGGWFRTRRRQRRLLEQARETHMAQLEQAVVARTQELRTEMDQHSATEARAAELREGLRQANRLATLGQVSAGVAHETAQPVAAIRTFAGNGRQLIERGALEEAMRNFETIANLADRIGSVTSQLRAFSRKQTGRLQSVALGRALDGALLILKERLRAIAMTIDPAIETIYVRAGRVRLEQILVNLLQNAADALEGHPHGAITVTAECDDKSVRLIVRDNGAGLTAEMKERLFTPFATSREGGLGLGLVISRDIARDLGGDLHYEDGPGGATFVLTVSLAEGVPA